MRFWLVLTSIVPLVAFAGAVRASTQTDMQDCQQMEELDRSISGCSRLTADQSLAASDRAIAYFDRGLAYYARTDLDHAIADWSEAIALNPTYAHAYNNRGKAYRAKGDYAHAIADYGEAIKLDPRRPIAYKGRGIAYFLSGDYVKAQADFRQAESIEPDAYAVLWLDLAARRANQPIDLKQAMEGVNMGEWPAPLLLLYSNQATAHDVAVAAQNMDKKVTNARLCDAYFYTAESLLLQNGQATQLFQRAIDTCQKSVDEYSAAAAELKALGKPVEAQSPGAEQKAEGAKPTP